MRRDWIKDIRKAAGLTQAEAARRSGRTLRSWQGMEYGEGRHAISMDTVMQIAKALEQDPMRLLDEEIKYIQRRDGV